MSISSSGQTRISLHVYPNSLRNQVVGFSDGVLGVRVAASPVRGQANRELIAFLSQLLDISKDSLAILKGHTSRHKLITVRGLSREEVLKKLFPG